MKPPERDSSSLSGEDNACPSAPLGRGSRQAAVVTVHTQWSLLGWGILSLSRESALEQGIAFPSWPGSGEVSTATLSSTPRSPPRSRPPLGWEGWDVLSVARVEVHHHKVPSILISPFCHRKAEDFIILTVLHTHQVRLASSRAARTGLKNPLGDKRTLETLGDHSGSSADLLDPCPPPQGSSEGCHGPLGSAGMQPCPHPCHQEGGGKNIPKAIGFAENVCVMEQPRGGREGSLLLREPLGIWEGRAAGGLCASPGL